MKVNITARHLELTPSLREFSEKKLQNVKKYTDKITNAHVILNVEKDRHIAEVVLSISKNNINAKAVAGDMYAAIDMVVDKASKQLRRHMDRIKEHKDVPTYAMVENLVMQERHQAANGEYQLEKIKEKHVSKQTFSEAIEIINQKSLNFWIFEDINEPHLNIVYKRGDGKFGMLVVK